LCWRATPTWWIPDAVAEAQGYESNAREAQELTKWHIHHIRQAFEVNPRKPSHLINVRGKGYRLIVD
jgi:DNA-binding response OmpR family regulator